MRLNLRKALVLRRHNLFGKDARHEAVKRVKKTWDRRGLVVAANNYDSSSWGGSTGRR